ncbi:hypothetical protein HWB52_gp61 [Pseudomonas phage Littlefix]|uniref:Uncharacterized protein n=1 Tax=Pseudomonas phage Littlefix TaxID=2079289 RepID=A0A2K9VHN7_9CAUD|nr:hypothetical protein HWB52_gp61 [Pseudomonas phage Littlefix]AUV61876.1 hypothetical protein PsPhLittlefix_gp61 [Pseudomonas phage Littlefix]
MQFRNKLALAIYYAYNKNMWEHVRVVREPSWFDVRRIS